jgi:hypothetical protein
MDSREEAQEGQRSEVRRSEFNRSAASRNALETAPGKMGCKATKGRRSADQNEERKSCGSREQGAGRRRSGHG